MYNILFFVFAIVLTIVLGYIFSVNIGIIAIVASYFLSLYFGISSSALMLMWPSKLFLTIFAISLFYSFASSNGAIEKLAQKIIYLFRKVPALIPFVLFLVTALIAGSGGGPYVSTVVMTPIIIDICRKINMKPLLGAFALTFAGSSASLSGISLVGLLVKSLIEDTVYATQASTLQNQIFINAIIFYTLAFLLFYIILGGYKVKATTLEKPDKFTKKQASSLILVAAVIILYILPTLLHLVFPDNTIITLIKSKADFAFFAFFGAVLGFILKFDSEKEVFKKTSWSTLILISGMGMLVAVGEQAGIIEQISEFVASNVSSKLIPQMIAAASGVLSYVADGPCVVYPTLYPLIAQVANLTGTDPAILFTAISIGDSTTVISPFSTGGAIFLTFITDVKERNKIFTQFLIAPFVILALLIVALSLGIFI